MKKILPIVSLAVLLTACATLYSSVVTITSVVDTAMKAWAEASVKGITTPAVDAKVKEVHAKYVASCAVASKALKAYKDTGDQSQYLQALAVVKASAVDLVALITPFIASDTATKLNTNLSKANKI